MLASKTALLHGTLLFALLAFAAAVRAQATASAPAPSNANLASAQCVIGEERVLPGDYYYCLGTSAYAQKQYGQSKRFFRTAASWASKPAQYVLGVMALNGDHQPVNRPLALAWFTLASERPDSRFKDAHDALYKASSDAERNASEQWLERMRLSYGDAVAAVRAEKRYREGMKALARLNHGGNAYCMEGLLDVARLPAIPSRCPPIGTVMHALDEASVNVFKGWAAHVSVGPPQPVNGPPGPDADIHF